MPDVTMPRLSDSMEEGTILRWLKGDGEHVERGEELLEIETDKATMTFEADNSGVLAIVAQEGSTVPVGAVIGHLGEQAEAPAGTAAAAGVAEAAEGSVAASPTVGGVATMERPRANGRPNASPVARRTAERLQIDLSSVTGSGPYGRILKADVTAVATAPAHAAAAAPEVPPASAAAPAPAAAPARDGESTFEELSRTQAIIARRMAESRTTVPEFSLQVDVDMSAAIELRARLKELSDPTPSVNDFVVKASACALRKHPRANGSYRDGRFELHRRVIVGVAVAAADALLVPTVHDADVKSLAAIAAETRGLAERGRAGRLTPAELEHGTFTVSNLGMFGIDRFEGIINVPEAAILCVGAIRDRVVPVNGEIGVRPMMTLTLACDHRILYGADAARFLGDIRRFLEEPLLMAV